MDFYIPGIVKDWSSITIDLCYGTTSFGVLGFSAKSLPELGMKFMPVFDSKEECLKYYPDASILTLKHSEPKEDL